LHITFKLTAETRTLSLDVRETTSAEHSSVFGNLLGPAFPASHVQHISDMHSKFALRPHHVSKYGKHPISDR